MNWIEIETKYTKAFNDYLKHIGGSVLLVDGSLVRRTLVPSVYDFINERDLYDFFDENEIYILPEKTEFEEGIEWGWDLISDCEYGFNSRPEAESAAFTKAFEILENKLK